MPPMSTIMLPEHNEEIHEAEVVGEQNLLPMTIMVEMFNHDENSSIILGEQKIPAVMMITAETPCEDKGKKRAAGKIAKKCETKDNPIKMPQPALMIMAETPCDDKGKKRAAGKTAKKCGTKDNPIEMPQPALMIMVETPCDDKGKKRAAGKMATKCGMKDDLIKSPQPGLLPEKKRARMAKKGATINKTTTMMAENQMVISCHGCKISENYPPYHWH